MYFITKCKLDMGHVPKMGFPTKKGIANVTLVWLETIMHNRDMFLHGPFKAKRSGTVGTLKRILFFMHSFNMMENIGLTIEQFSTNITFE